MADRFESLLSLLGDDVSLRWLITLLHFLWQGAVVGGVVAIAGRLLRGASARSRYALYSAALLSLPVCVAVTSWVVDVPASLQPSSRLKSPADIPALSSALPSQATAITAAVSLETAEATDAPVRSERVLRTAATMKAVADDNSESLSHESLSHSSLAMLSRAAPWIAVAYVVGVACFLLRLSAALWGGHRLRTRTARVTDAKLLELIADQADRVKLKCVPVVAYCERVAVPTVVGVLRPMVLLPVSLMTGLTPDDFAAIIRHELAHIRRYDLWMNLLQRVIESLLFFHPVVWFISRRLSAEREVCCDDLVVSSGCEPMHYAGALLRMAELCALSRQPGALALAATGDKTPLLERRIERLMNWGNTPRLKLTRAGMAGLLMTFVSLIVVPGIAHTWAQAQAEEAVQVDDPLPAAPDTSGVPKQTPEPPETKEEGVWSNAVASEIVADEDEGADAAGGEESTSEKPKTVDDLIVAFSNATYFWQQGDIARELIALGDAQIVPKMEKYLDTEDRRRRCNAGLVLAGLGDKRGLAIIINELKDEKPRPTLMRRSDGSPYHDGQIREDRYYSALLLGQLGDREAVPALIQATKDATINYRAAVSLGEIGDKDAIPALRKMAIDFPDERLWAGYGLAALSQPEGFDILTGVIISDSQWTDRRHAVEALGTIGHPKAVPIVVKALKDKHVNVRVSAARALGAIGDSVALPALREALNDTEVTKIHAPTTVEKEARKAIEAIKASGKPKQTAEPPATKKKGAELPPGTEEKLEWGEPANGLRAALVRPPALGEPETGEVLDFNLVVQNVSNAPIRLSATSAAPNPRRLFVRKKGVTLYSLVSKEPTQADFMLQPREVAVLRMFPPDEDRGTSIAENPDLTFCAEMEIEHAPAGAWTGRLYIGETSGAVASGKPRPKDESAQSLFRKWQGSARINGNIPGGALGSLAAAASNFVKHNPTDERAPKLAELLKRIDTLRDWTQADAVTLLDDVTAIYANLPRWAEEQTRFSTAEVIRTGQPLPADLEDAPWGEAQPNGLSAAWLLEPHAEQHRLGTPLKSRVLFHNAGKNAVVFRALTWNQSSGHKARDANGAEIKIMSTRWTTIPQVVACRLAPGEFTEVTGAGIGVGANRDDEDWRGTRVGAWIEAKEGDEVTFTPAPVSANGKDDGRLRDESRWWLDFITDRLSRDMPLPDDAGERKRLLDRAMRDLFGTAPTPEETATFVADGVPDAMSALANRLAQRAGISPFTGTLQAGETKFRVLAVDLDAAKRPRVATGPGRYTLGDLVRLVIVRKLDGKRYVNEANIRFFSRDPRVEPPGKPHEIKLPDGLLTWAIAWERDSTVLWVAEKGVLRSYDFATPAQVKETRIEPAGITNVPEPLREALRPAIEGGSNNRAKPRRAPAPAAAKALP